MNSSGDRLTALAPIPRYARATHAVALASFLVMAAACGDTAAPDDDDDISAEDIENEAEAKCEARAGCDGGNAVDRAACVQAELNVVDEHRALGCQDEAVDSLTCFANNGSCFGASLVADECGRAEIKRQDCIREAGSDAAPGPEVDAAYVSYCQRRQACLLGPGTVVSCSYGFQGAKREAAAYGCQAEHDAHFACLETNAECAMGSFDAGICQDELAARAACVAQASAFD